MDLVIAQKVAANPDGFSVEDQRAALVYLGTEVDLLKQQLATAQGKLDRAGIK